MEAHCIPCETELLRTKNFPDFLRERRRLIISALRKYFGNL